MAKEKQTMTAKRVAELFAKPTNEEREDLFLSVCVGSWKAYNECTEHSLGSDFDGSFFIDFMKLNGSEELAEVLDFLGWTKEEQEELFVQDYESNFMQIKNCDYENPYQLADLIYNNREKLEYATPEKIRAIIEYQGGTLAEALESLDDFDFFHNTTAEDYEREMIRICYDIPEWLTGYIDYRAIARDDDRIYEYGNGVLIVC